MNETTKRRLAAIVSADVVGYSRLMGRDEAGTLRRLTGHRSELIDPLIAKHGGRIVKTTGDGLLLEFASVVAAVECCIAVQRGMAERNDAAGEEAGENAMTFRIGLHLGDVIVQDDDIFGDGVNIAARLQEIGDAGGVAISANAHDSVEGRIKPEFSDGGEVELKNTARPVRVWRWSLDGGTLTAAAGEPPLALPGKPAIAVLPFDNMSADPEQEYFSDGITEDVITGISRLPEVMVISRNSSFTYKGKAAKVQDVCRDLGVGYVLEGSVRKAGNRVRITAQLIDGNSGGHLWAERYDRGLEDIFAVQDDVTEKIVRALELQLAAGPAEAGAPTGNLEAYDCVLRGREQYGLFSPSSNAAARALFEQAAALDPDYAEPYAGLSESYVQDWFMGTEPNLDRAYELAQQAVARGPNLPLVQEALSTVQLFQRHHGKAITAARRWIALEPSNADAHATLAGALHFSGENQEMITLIEKAMRLNPIYPFFYPHYVGMANLAMHRFEAAVVALRRGAGRNPEVLWPHVFLAACYGHLGDDTSAAAEVVEVRRINPEFTIAALLRLLPYKNNADVETLTDGLAQAGLSA